MSMFERLAAALENGRTAADAARKAPGVFDRVPDPYTLPEAQLALDGDALLSPAGRKTTEDPNGIFAPRGSLVLGDNLACMARLLAQGQGGAFDFIYIDPPFFSGAHYKAQKEGEKVSVYEDRWPGGLAGYLEMLAPRLLLMRELLAESGSIAIHADWHAVHYIKVLADEIFGRERFLNELIWSYKSGGASTRSFARKHDNLLVYTKSKAYYFEPQKEVSYNRGKKPYRFKGVEEFQDAEGAWYTLVNRKDVLSVDMVGRTSAERNGYATQKPLALRNILLGSRCPEGGLAADLVAGSGTLAEAAASGGRRFLACDAQPLAVEIASRRLSDRGILFDLFRDRV